MAQALSYSYEIDMTSLIEERKLDRKRRAEERRLNDLKLIESINAKNDDGVNPDQVFPNELWDKISRYLVDHQSFESMRDACTLFRGILEDRKTDFLFSKALDLICFMEELEEDSPFEKPLLNARCVSNSWRNIYDRHLSKIRLDNQLSVHLFQNRPASPLLNKEWTLLFAFYQFPDNEKKLGNIRRAMKLKETFDSDKPAALKRLSQPKLAVRLESLEAIKAEFNEFANAFAGALQNVGKQIWNFCIKLNLSNQVYCGETLREVYTSLVKWVKLMPNLECLEVSLSWQEAIGDPVLDEVIRNLPFPTMMKLKHLRITLGRKHGPTSILEAILRSNQNTKLENLKVRGVISEESERIIQLIQSLHLTSFCFKQRGDTHRLDEIDRLLNPSWRLKQLKLDYYTKVLSFTELFRLLERYQTLETLVLEILCTEELGDDRDWSKEGDKFLRLLNLANFKFFMNNSSQSRSTWKPWDSWEWEGLDYYFSIDYLLYCSRLECLDWCNFHRSSVWCGGEIRRKKDLIQFDTGRSDLDESNIWKVFPNLKHVTMRDYMGFPEDCERPEA